MKVVGYIHKFFTTLGDKILFLSTGHILHQNCIFCLTASSLGKEASFPMFYMYLLLTGLNKNQNDLVVWVLCLNKASLGSNKLSVHKGVIKKDASKILIYSKITAYGTWENGYFGQIHIDSLLLNILRSPLKDYMKY